MADSFAILPKSMGQARPKAKTAPDPKQFVPSERGGLLVENPNEELCPYTFSDSPGYTRMQKKQAEEKRALELESKEETRGFMRSIEELCKRQKWDEALNVLEKRTTAASGFFYVTRAVLRWKQCKFAESFQDAEYASKAYGSTKAGALAAAFSSFACICLGSEPQRRNECNQELRVKILAWEDAEQNALKTHALGQGLFQPRQSDRSLESCLVQGVETMEAHDGSYITTQGTRIGYVLLKNQRVVNAPIILHFHGPNETASDYRTNLPTARHYSELPAHVLVVDYRGYGWSSGTPSLATCLRDAEIFAERLGETLVEHGFPWPYSNGLILSGRSVGAHVAVHLSTLFPILFRALILESSAATAASGDRLGRATQRAEALLCWQRELEQSNLEVLQPVADDLRIVSDLEKIRSFEGNLLVIHGMADVSSPYDASESLYTTAGTKQKELVLIEGAGHDDMDKFEEYFAAKRRFLSKVQLADTLPSLHGQVEHLCAVCAEKAMSKCGRCQKVWYCGRKHQAEHWKIHKGACAGSAPEPKPKIDPVESEVFLAAVLATDVCCEDDAAALEHCLASLASQKEQALGAVYIGWRAQSDLLATLVRESIAHFKQRCEELSSVRTVVAVEASESRRQFEHLKFTIAENLASAPAHTWFLLAKPCRSGEIWNSSRAAALLPTLRRADAKTIAVSGRRRARPFSQPTPGTHSTSSAQVANVNLSVSETQGIACCSDAVSVDEALAKGTAERYDATERCLSDVAVRQKALLSFLESSPPGLLAHDLCAYRFMYTLSHTFGKKVQDFEPPNDDWMYWAHPVHAASEIYENGSDVSHGKELWDQLPNAVVEEQTSESSASTHHLFCERDAVAAVHRFRIGLERAIIQSAGERLSTKELRSLVVEHVRDMLEMHSLSNVIGLQKWMRELATGISERSVEAFGVKVVDAP